MGIFSVIVFDKWMITKETETNEIDTQSWKESSKFQET